MIWRWFWRERWWLETPIITFGPFKSREHAANYPNTFMGFVDSPTFRRGPFRVYRDDAKRGGFR